MKPTKKIFTVGNIPVFIEAESAEEASEILGECIDTLVQHGPDIIYEIESEISEVTIDKSRLN